MNPRTLAWAVIISYNHWATTSPHNTKYCTLYILKAKLTMVLCAGFYLCSHQICIHLQQDAQKHLESEKSLSILLCWWIGFSQQSSGHSYLVATETFSTTFTVYWNMPFDSACRCGCFRALMYQTFIIREHLVCNILQGGLDVSRSSVMLAYAYTISWTCCYDNLPTLPTEDSPEFTSTVTSEPSSLALDIVSTLRSDQNM